MPTKSKLNQILVAASGITGIVGDLTHAETNTGDLTNVVGDLTNAGTNTGGLTNVSGGLTNV